MTSSRTAQPWESEGVYQLHDGSWMVPSSGRAPGTAGTYYHVIFEQDGHGPYFTCTCPHGLQGGRRLVPDGLPGADLGRRPCRHIISTHTARKAHDKALYGDRPQPRVNVAALVD